MVSSSTGDSVPALSSSVNWVSGTGAGSSGTEEDDGVVGGSGLSNVGGEDSSGTEEEGVIVCMTCSDELYGLSNVGGAESSGGVNSFTGGGSEWESFELSNEGGSEWESSGGVNG